MNTAAPTPTLIPIVEPDDPRIADFRSLTDVTLRKKLEPERGLYIAESIKVLRRALAAGHEPRAVLTQEKWLPELLDVLGERGLPIYVVGADIAEQITGYAVHRGVLASMQRPAEPSIASVLDGARRVVILEDIVDHTNVGAIFRSVAALGGDAILVSPECADPLYRRSVRVSMGTVFQVPWTRVSGWRELGEELHNAGFHIAALALREDAETLHELVKQHHERLALVFGTEGHGLSTRALAICDSIVMIPMGHGVDSLNVAASSAVTLWATRPV